jgi:Spy/CpxP family protein refolding chaperone
MKLIRCLIAVLMLTPVVAFAEMKGDANFEKMGKMGGPKMGAMSCGQMCDYSKFKKELGLTDDQTKQIKDLCTGCMKADVKREADIKIARIDMMGLMKNDTPDFAGIKEKEKQVAALELEGKLAMIDCREKCYNVLTKEQQSKLPSLMKEKMEKMKGMKKEGMKNCDMK